MGAVLIPKSTKTLTGSLLIEHLAALGVLLLAVGWLMVLVRLYDRVVVESRQRTTAYYAARVVLVHLPVPGGETTVQVGPDVWQVTVNTQEVKAHAQKGRSTYTFTP